MKLPYLLAGLICSVTTLPTLAHPPKADPMHGWTAQPLARQTYCYDQQDFWNGEQGIKNPACKAAYIKSKEVSPDNPAYPFQQRNEFSALVKDYENLDAVKAVIKDGTLCAAGDPRKAGMDVVSKDWHREPLAKQEDGTFAVQFKATATHDPSFWQIFVSKPGYDAAKTALAWGDLEKIGEFRDIKPDPQGVYHLKVSYPKDRHGPAVIYTRWQRIDPAGEGFYNCSDVTLQ